ncbi:MULTISPECIES: hypothetical protein [Streptomyces]|uniref:hypothetical protein n=1 Tax=Streptomyces TaxID=1883 RepID=UPI0004CD9EDB|nr:MULTISPECIES: hypothetical protein [Streptomyces]
MSRYLEEAADLLRKAAEAHEETVQKYICSSRQANEPRERLAREFATLAAIDKGLLPAEMVQDVLRAVTGRNGGA